MKNGTRTLDEGFDLARRWESIGLTASQFAEQEGVTHHTVRYLAGRLCRHHAEQAVQAGSGFIEIRTVPAALAQAVSGVPIFFQNGVRVEFGTCHDLAGIL